VIVATLLTLALAMTSPAAIEPEELPDNDCYQQVEAFHQAYEEDYMPPSVTGPVDAKLDAMILACEAGDMAAVQHLAHEATLAYDALVKTGPHGVTQGDLYQAMRYWWGTLFTPLVEDIRWLPITNDDDPDFVALYLQQDNPDGLFYEVLAVAKDAKTGQVQQAFISLPVGTSDQIGLCGDGQNIDVSWHTVMASEARSFLKGVAEENWHALIIDDGKCDKVWLLWPIGAEGNQVDWRAVRR
tara:strand:- start:413 stop:1138 length:726 start_codon:yes stop_codon:yes gene_type:complete